MLIVVRSVLYISRVLRTLVSDYDSFVQHTKFICNICKLIYLTVVIFFYITAYFWFVRSHVVLVLRKAIFTLACLNKLVILRTNGL